MFYDGYDPPNHLPPRFTFFPLSEPEKVTDGRRLDTVYYEVIVGGTDIDDNNRENLFSDYNFDWGNKFCSTNNYCDMAETAGLNKKQNKEKDKVTKILEKEVETEEEENGNGNNSDSTLKLQRKPQELFGVQVGSGENNQKKVNEQVKQLVRIWDLKATRKEETKAKKYCDKEKEIQRKESHWITTEK